MRRSLLRYTWLSYRRDTLWFPLAFLAVFVLVTAILDAPEIRFVLARTYLGFLLPLAGGVMAAYALLEDPALELRFSTPERPRELLLARLGLIVGVEATTALLYQLAAFGLGVDLRPLGTVLDVQLVWLPPCLVLVALGTAGALASAQTAMGAFLAGGAWLLHVVMKGWFVANAPAIYLFLGALEPDHPQVTANRLLLLASAVFLLVLSAALLRRQERFL